MALGALTLARSRAQEKKLLPAITFTGERFVESGNDHASDTEVLVIALLVILFEPSPNETQERAALARARTRANSQRHARACAHAQTPGSKGQLGLGKTRSYPSAQLVWGMMRKGVRQIGAGDYHSAALTYNGLLYTWGAGSMGQLGHGRKRNELLPKMVEALDREVGKPSPLNPFHHPYTHLCPIPI